jgi:hypothetical protein
MSHLVAVMEVTEITKLEDMRWKALDLVDDDASILIRASFLVETLVHPPNYCRNYSIKTAKFWANIL